LRQDQFKATTPSLRKEHGCPEGEEGEDSPTIGKTCKFHLALGLSGGFKSSQSLLAERQKEKRSKRKQSTRNVGRGLKRRKI